MRDITNADIPGLKLALEHCTKYEDRQWFSFLINMHARLKEEAMRPRITVVGAPKQLWNKSWQLKVVFSQNGEEHPLIIFLSPNEWPTDQTIRAKARTEYYKIGGHTDDVRSDIEVVRS